MICCVTISSRTSKACTGSKSSACLAEDREYQRSDLVAKIFCPSTRLSITMYSSILSTKQSDMRNRMLLMMLFAGLVCSCDLKKKEVLQKTTDSLRVELQANRTLTSDMMEIGSMLDTIDASRGALRARMIEGATYETYVARMRNITSMCAPPKRKYRLWKKRPGEIRTMMRRTQVPSKN